MPYSEEKQGKHNTGEIPIITTLSELENLMKEKKNWHVGITLGKRFIVEDSNNIVGDGNTIQEAIGRALS